MFDNRKFVILPATEVNQIDFNEVMETSIETMRYTVDGTQTFVKYEGVMPSSISSIQGKSQEYGYEDFLTILSQPEWNPENKLG